MDLTSQHPLEVETKGQCQLEVETQGSASQSEDNLAFPL